MLDSGLLLRSLYHHLVLPPRQPGREDGSQVQEGLVQELLQRIKDATQQLQTCAPDALKSGYDVVFEAVSACRAVNTAQGDQQQNVRAAFNSLQPYRPLILHIAQQNAGLLIWRCQRFSGASTNIWHTVDLEQHGIKEDDYVVFEVFEASPCSEAVFSTNGALQLVFPGSSYAIPFSDFQDFSFQESLSRVIELACHERLPRFSARTHKANTSVIEQRDTANPELITTWLATVLEANGSAIDVSPIAKRVKDEVCWSDGARSPWRRMPFYLVMRIGLRRSFQLMANQEGKLHYKLLVTKVLSSLLRDLMGRVPWEMLAFIRAKICRRMAKLEELNSANQMTPSFQVLFREASSDIQKTISAMSNDLENAWSRFKLVSRRVIEPLFSTRAPFAALPQDMFISRNSLMNIITLFNHERYANFIQPPKFDASRMTMTQYDMSVKPFLDLLEIESKLYQLSAMSIPESKSECRIICCELSTAIIDYIVQFRERYGYFIELASDALLTLMDLWTTIDQCAMIAFPVLREFKPVFPLNVLDALHVTSWKHMQRIQRVQAHLQCRYDSATSNLTILHDPVKNCVAERFFDTSDEMKAVFREIEEEAENKRVAKEQELAAMMAKRRAMEAEYLMQSCLVLTTNDFPPREIHRYNRCPKCQLQKEIRSQKILVHEHPLPQDTAHAKAMVFELCLPQAFALYRDATWAIVKWFGQRHGLPLETLPGTSLSDYPPLQEHRQTRDKRVVGLASMKKSFMLSHWKQVDLPTTPNDVCLPCALEPIYFDFNASFSLQSANLSPTFAWMLRQRVSPDSPFSFVSKDDDFIPERGGPSSNKIISSQSDCPITLSVHEYLSFKALFTGSARRWPLMLLEMGSSNINFSNEVCCKAISTITAQAGPCGTEDSILRVVHQQLSDTVFCEQMLSQIAIKLKLIEANWRETHCMDMLVNLLLRIIVACPANVTPEALALLETARSHLGKWMRALVAEFRQSTSLEASRLCSQYSLQAALMCRRTFSIYVKSGFSRHSSDGSLTSLDASALNLYTLAAVTLQNSVKELTRPTYDEVHEAILQDIRLVQSLRSPLLDAFHAYPAAIIDALYDVGMVSQAQWPQSIRVLPTPDDMWIEMILSPPNAFSRPQMLHFNTLAGHVLIDNTPLGKLAEEFRTSPILEELFGETNLYAIPSDLPGMKYRLNVQRSGNEIHVGSRNGAVVVRVRNQGRLWEILERRIFVAPNPRYSDLPYSLIHDCLPFLDLQSHTLELRRIAGNVWRLFPSDWRLSLRDWKMMRHTQTRTFTLVNYQGRFYDRVLKAFHNFEDDHRVLVYQPDRGPLELELRRLELKFFVNQKFLFESHKLGCEIPVNQDAGCLYGLKSALVIQDTKNQANRHVLVPFGPMTCTRRGIHIELIIKDSGSYARYSIDPVLGRLHSAAQPRLLYRKALVHALTSFIVPDPLTRRTGTEEAMHTLASGVCQPTFPLEGQDLVDLSTLRGLAPDREFYPLELQCMQKVSWRPELAVTAQHDGYLLLVDRIYDACDKLCMLFPNAVPPVRSTNHSDLLVQRGVLQRARFERPNVLSEALQTPADAQYAHRHDVRRGAFRDNTFNTANLVRSWPSRLPMPPNFGRILETHDRIGGFSRPFNGLVSLSSCMDLHEALSLGLMVEFCRRSTYQSRYDLMFVVSLAAYKQFNMDLMMFWLAFAFFDELKAVDAPRWESYFQYRIHQHPHVPGVLQLLRHVPTFDPRNALLNRLSSVSVTYSSVPYLESPGSVDIEGFAQHLVDQFPCQIPQGGPYHGLTAEAIRSAMAVVEPEFLRLFQNLQLSEFLDQVETTLEGHRAPVSALPQSRTSDRKPTNMEWHVPRLVIASMRSLFETAAKPQLEDSKIRSDPRNTSLRSKTSKLNKLPSRHVAKSVTPKANQQPDSSEIKELRRIFADLEGSESSMMKQYIGDLAKSLDAFRTVEQSRKRQTNGIVPDLTASNSQGGEGAQVQACLQRLLDALFAGREPIVDWLQLGVLLPCTSPTSLLEQLRSHTGAAQKSALKTTLVQYGLAITQDQRLRRIMDAKLKDKTRKISEESKHYGHGNWSPMHHPDWLLIELDGNILIRDEQVVVALATIAPGSGANALLQMNMGQGKTSVIIPMVAAALADKKHLARILVPRQLLPSTATLLNSRVGGLLGREIWHMPYSRRTDSSQMVTMAYCDLQRQAKRSAAIFLAAPEHIMSFKLCGLQHLSDGRLELAGPMLRMQDWLNTNARDVVDESDFVFSPRTALCFPSGNQTIVDGHPYRWRVIEALLKLVQSNVCALQHEMPGSIEVIDRQNGGFPFIFFLRRDVEERLISRTVAQVLHDQSILSVQNFSSTEITALGDFISNVKPADDSIDFVKFIAPDEPKVKKIVHLLRGLIVHRILLLTLKKRWNVQYGIDPRRDPMAVPFNAKGVPSDQSEWGHPDVAILFTVLSHYYSGLSVEQTRQSLALVGRSDDPVRAYQALIHDCNGLKGTYRDWEAINTDDESQLLDIWREIRFNTSVTDHYLNSFVFPRHAKQFRIKLQASGWDIPLFSPSHDQRTSLTTGFSGTNDNRRILPLTIQQQDLPSLAHTSAEVLTYLLQPRNRSYHLAIGRGGRRMTERDILFFLGRSGIRVLLDAGAQILEMSNEQVARAWLEIDLNAPAAVYFDQKDVATVLYRQGTRMPLLVSPFAEDLSGILVYIDESHCRGTDLMLPDDARGALTLGMSLQKDTLIQSAMRLRQLGTTQSVCFIAPPEVHQSIKDVTKVASDQVPTSAHIVKWLLRSTCEQLESLSPLFHSHGVDFCRRVQSALDNPNLHDDSHRSEYLEVLRQQERQSLIRLYEPRNKTQTAESQAVTYSNPQLKAFVKELTSRRRAFQDTGNAVHASALQEVEQEREVEVEVEVEKVREVQRPNWYQPYATGDLDHYIIKFIATGRLPPRQTAGYEHMFDFLKRTATGKRYGVTKPEDPSALYLTAEFAATVQCPHNRPDDSFLRPIQWLLWSTESEEALLVSPEEAEQIIPVLRTQENARVHLLTYAAPITRKMLHFNDLKYYAIPSIPNNYSAPMWLRVELGFFAGRIYFDWREYESVLRFLGLEYKGTSNHKARRTFTSKPLAFLQDWISARRKMQDWSSSPMGFIVAGKELHAQHAFFATLDGTLDADNKVIVVSQAVDEQHEEEYEDDDVYVDALDHTEADAGEEDWDDRKPRQDGVEEDSEDSDYDAGDD